MPLSLSGTTGIVSSNIAAGGVQATNIGSNQVITAKILDANVTPAKLSQPMTLMSGQVATGGSVLFSGIPSWAKRVTVMLYEVGTSGSSAHINVQIGDSGGLRTNNYVSTSVTVDSSGNTAGVSAADGFIWANFANFSTNRNTGTVQLTHVGSNVWVANHTGRQSTANSVFGGGSLNNSGLSGALDRVQIAATGLNSGSINVMYEG